MQKITNALTPVTLRPRGQTGLEAKIWLGTLNAEIKIQLCVVGIVHMCSYTEISTCDLGLDFEDLVSPSASWFWPQPRLQPQSFGLSLGVLASSNITDLH